MPDLWKPCSLSSAVSSYLAFWNTSALIFLIWDLTAAPASRHSFSFQFISRSSRAPPYVITMQTSWNLLNTGDSNSLSFSNIIRPPSTPFLKHDHGLLVELGQNIKLLFYTLVRRAYNRKPYWVTIDIVNGQKILYAEHQFLKRRKCSIENCKICG